MQHDGALHPLLESWFSDRGWTPFAFQRETWAKHRAGCSGLVHAPTGLGKTLAVWLGPVNDWLEANPDRGAWSDKAPPLTVLWITPLRALAQDTITALQAPLGELGLPWSVELRTGDTSSSVKQRQRKQFPTALVTTPESLSLLLSYPDTAARLSHLRAVVVDEWHELLSSKRGVQTEVALARLRSLAPRLQTWGLSATLGNLDDALAALLGPAADPAKSVLIPGRDEKRIEIDTILPDSLDRFPWAGHLGLKLLDRVLSALDDANTTLLFCNTRSQTELWFKAILDARPDLLGLVAIHHGSLDRQVRTEVENLLRQGRLRCVVCTSSLDLGVDFSPVDQVIQVGSPKGVARLMQRAGRSGHQPGAISRVRCAPTHAFELIEFAAARDAVAKREIESRRSLRVSLDVLVQHLVTLALGGGFDPDDLLREVRTTRAFAELTDGQWQWCLDFAHRGGPSLTAYPQHTRIRPDAAGRYGPASDRVARFHRMSIGTITSDGALRVAYQTGKTLGHIEESFISRLRPGDRFVFAGRVLELIRVRDMTAHVKRAASKKGVVPRWGGSKTPLSSQLAHAVRRRLDAARAGEYDGPEMTLIRPLLELQSALSTIPAPDELLVEQTATREGHHIFLFPFAGRLVHEGLAALLAHRLAAASPRTMSMTVNDYGLELLSPDPLRVTDDELRSALTTDNLLHDMLRCLNESELARRRFRDIARVAGLVFPGYPGMGKSARQLQASADLFYDVFHDFDAGNLLLDQARREVLDQQLEVVRLRSALEAASAQRLLRIDTDTLTPLAFPLYAETLRTQHVSSEKWEQRIARMALQLERRADHALASA